MKKSVSRMNLKPVMGDVQADPMKVLRQMKVELHRRIKLKIEESAFSRRAKEAFAKAVQIRVQPKSLLIMTTHPGFLPMIKGQQGGQMRWLVKAKRPIPMFTDEGELIFRSATPKSMADGKWVHPGRQPTDFIDRAKREARQFIREKLTKVLLQQIRAAAAQGAE